MKLLMLGGTADARKIAAALLAENLEVIYSVAGLVRRPKLDCTVISGGFSKVGGLTSYLVQQQIEGVIDATHPYAVNMSQQALLCCKQLGLPYFCFTRAPWQQQQGDHWINVAAWPGLIKACAEFDRPFLTTGQLQQSALEQISTQSKAVIYRTAAPSKALLANNVQWIKAIGPFNLEQEQALMQDLGVDVLVSKNAGGEATIAKLAAARALNIPVIMLQRPSMIKTPQEGEYTEVTALLASVNALVKRFNKERTQ